MTKVDRVVLARGEWHEVACALLQDGTTSPVVELMSQLSAQVWPDPDVEEFPDAYQSTMRSRFLAEVEHLATEGEPARDYDFLEDGIWEFKIASLRVTFYDTAGDGNYDAKNGKPVPGHAWSRRREFPEYFDWFVRLGHYFPKLGQKTRKNDINKAYQVRKEDLSHDTVGAAEITRRYRGQ